MILFYVRKLVSNEKKQKKTLYLFLYNPNVLEIFRKQFPSLRVLQKLFDPVMSKSTKDLHESKLFVDFVDTFCS